LKDKGVLVFALGIGSGVSRSQLLEIASNSKSVFSASSFEELKFKVRPILNTICTEGKDNVYVMSKKIMFSLICCFVSFTV
jgi:hypothetical protein